MPKKQITIGPLSQEDEQRLWRKVQKKGPSGCWLWFGGNVGRGCGKVK